MSAEATLLEQGVDLMIYGMGTVFVFLTLLVLATNVMSRLVRMLERRIPAPAEPAAAKRRELDPAVVAAITAALHRHRQSGHDVPPRR